MHPDPNEKACSARLVGKRVLVTGGREGQDHQAHQLAFVPAPFSTLLAENDEEVKTVHR